MAHTPIQLLYNCIALGFSIGKSLIDGVCYLWILDIGNLVAYVPSGLFRVRFSLATGC